MGSSTEPRVEASSLVELLRWRARHQGERGAYTFLDGETRELNLTYGELDRRARAIGALLQDLGASGRPALLLYPAGPDYVAAFFGCLYGNTTAVPAYPPRSQRSMPRIRTIVTDAQATVVLTTRAIYAKLERQLAELPDLAALTWRTSDEIDLALAEAWRDPRVTRDTLAFLQYTSGSTAAPKGVMVSHGNLLHNEELIKRACEHHSETPCVSWLPLYHDLGLIGNLIQSLYIGAPCTLMSPVAFLQRPIRWLEAITRYRAHTSGGPNFAYDLCVRKIAPEERERLDLSSWQVAFNGAEPVRWETLERFAEAFAPYGFRREAFFPCYGMAETTLIVSGGGKRQAPVVERLRASELERHRAVSAAGADARPLVGCGHALDDLRVAIVHPQTLLECAPDEVGEIWVAGPSVCQGYWNRPEETAATFGATLADSGEGPFLRTGDLGFLHDGELFITGRLKDLIIVRGQNHYPQDVEATVETCHAALRPGCGAAFSLAADDGGDERLVVVQELSRQVREPAPEEVDEIAGAVRRALAEEHELKLHALVLIRQGTLPKTTSGKIQRRKCRQDFLAGELQVVAAWRESAASVEETAAASAEEMTKWLVARLAARLGLDPGKVDPRRSLLHYGLDSLAAIELAHEIETRSGVCVALERLFEGCTLEELAAQLRAAQGAVEPVKLVASPEPPAQAPLSPGQRALWFLHQLEPDSPAYNIAGAVRIHGELDVAALRRAFQTLVDRHACLRTTIGFAAGEPVQRIHAEHEVCFTAQVASAGSDEDFRRRLDELAHQPFDLENGPLLRVTLVSRSRPDSKEAGERILLVATHHVVSDFWSLAVLLRELDEAYRAAREGRPAELPPLPLAFTDYVRWQSEMLAGPRGEALQRYWQRQLAGELPTLELPADRLRPRVQSTAGEAFSVRFGTAVTAGLKSLSRRCDTTLFVTLLAAYQVLLHRFTGQRQVLVGTPTAGRGQARLAGLVGYFVNPVVLSSELAGDPPLAAFIAAARATAGAAFEHQDYPFPTLVEQLQPVRDPSRSPLFQAMFALSTAPRLGEQDLTAFALGVAGARVRLGDLVLESVALEQGIAQFDLTLSMGELRSMGEVDGALMALVDYSRDLFDRTTIVRLGGCFRVLLEAAANAPEKRLSQLPVLARSERQHVLVEWNDTAEGTPAWHAVHELFELRAARDPAALAVAFEGARLTYGELDRRSDRLARRLRELGVGPERTVGLCLARSFDLIVSIFAILKAGGAYVALAPESAQARLAWILGDAGARVLVTGEDLAVSFASLLPDLEVISPEEPGGDGEGPALAKPDVSRRTAACVIYTSGSTGKPKGVVIEHGHLLRLIASFLDCYRPGPGDRILPVTAITSASFMGEILPVLSSGGAVILPNREQLIDFTGMIELIARNGVSILSTVPAVLTRLGSLHDRLPKLRLILSGGEALAAGALEALMDKATVVNSYGLTETTVCSTVHRLAAADLASGREISIGRPLADQQVYVVNRRFRVQPIGCPGEIYIGGRCVARGYLASPGKTAERFVPNPLIRGGRLYRTGDLGRWLAGGDLEFMGRSDQQVQIRGFRVELGEVEWALVRHPAVRRAAVVVRYDGAQEPRGQARLVAYVAFGAGASPPLDELFGDLRQRLPDYMVPAAIVVLEALPLLPNGKVDFRALPEPAPLRPELAAAHVAPLNELERAIAGVFQEVLGVEKVGIHDNFFDLGGHSLLLAQAHARLREVVGRELSLIALYQYPTVSALASHLDRESRGRAAQGRPVARRRDVEGGDTAIAIVGMSGRFPGAGSVDALWRNLVEGIESIVFFSDEELEAAGIDAELIANPNYVKAKGILGNVDLFDAQFFGHNPRVAELMDPQHRVFLECAWEALENAGYDAERYTGRIGVFAGQSMNTYWLNNLYFHIDLVASVDSLEAAIGNDKDSLTTEVSYRMNLKGPSVNVQSSSSTSLTAIHYACQSLLHGECEMALAGGVSIHLPEKSGYFYHEGGITSPDGHCRTFDAGAQGFVSGQGAGVVVLKRLAEALADGDSIVAVIKGSACNNDGSHKVSYMAPSVDGHAEVVVQAQQAAGVPAETIGYLEAHGTGTLMGDPIEVAALTQAFRVSTERRGFCAIGSLKTNIGHLDTAAGVAGLIKAALCLRHQTIPPSLHFEKPNPRIDFAASPFYVNDRLRPFESHGGMPRRAGVSSLGMGGTNTHVVLEEAPEAQPSGPSRPHQLLVLSAKTATALETATAGLADFLRRHQDSDLADVAFTLRAGRKEMPHRRMVVASDRGDAAAALASGDGERVFTSLVEEGHRSVVFLLSGQGSQYPGMARELYDGEPVFRREIDRCAELLRRSSPFWQERDLRTFIFPGEETAEAAEALTQTAVAQPALFAVEHAMAQLWMKWGVHPQAMIGHSIGELAAACLAGVFSLEDALRLVAARGQLMQQMPPGAMLAVSLAEPDVIPLLSAELALATVNRFDTCVVSGPETAMAGLEARLSAMGVEGRRLHTSHAFHSPMMEPILEPFRQEVAKTTRRPPQIPFMSNVTGTWIRPQEAVDPAYWARQLRGTVRFADGVGELLAEPNRVFVEIGPGHALASAVRQHPRRAGQLTVPSLRHPRERRSDVDFLLHTLGRLWLAGVEVDDAGFYAEERRRRVVLPTYPFERQRFWVEPLEDAGRGRRRVSPHVDDWFYVPVWKQSTLTVPAPQWPATPARWLVFADGGGLGALLVERLTAAGQEAVAVTPGEAYAATGPGAFTVRPGQPEDYEALLAALGAPPQKVLHLWSVTGEAAAGPDALERGFYSLLWLAQACGRRGAGDPRWRAPMRILAVSDTLHDVTGEDALAPAKAALLGPCRVMGREYPHLDCRSVDVAATSGGIVERILDEAALDSAGLDPAEVAIAYRGQRRWVQSFEPVRLDGGGASRLRERGVYLVTGGLGGLGLEVAEHLARKAKARLVLVGRSPLPERPGWDAWLASHGDGDPVSRKIRRLRALEALGAEVLPAAADVADPEAMVAVVAAAEERFGAIHGIVHAAGVAGGELMQLKTRESARRVLAPKFEGTRVLDAIFRERPLDFWVLFSSTTAVVAELGQADYAAANAFLDAFAHERTSRRGARTVAIDWDAWREVGMAVATQVPEGLREWRQERLRRGLSPRQGVAAFARVLQGPYPQVVVSREDFVARLASQAEGRPAEQLEDVAAATAGHARPDLASAYAAPESELEKSLAAIWQQHLGLDQVGVNDSFFELGGNSLIGLKVTARIKAELGVEASPVALFEAPTVRSLARLLAREDESVAQPSAGEDRGARRRARRRRRQAEEIEP
jgi:amino acid adenylation domain-containing protein